MTVESGGGGWAALGRDREAARRAAHAVAATRVIFGVIGFLMPRLFTRIWTGSAEPARAHRMLGRAVAARDAALGVGALVALNRDAPVRGWVEAGVLSDAGDALISLREARRRASPGVLGFLLASCGGVALGVLVAQGVDAEPGAGGTSRSATASPAGSGTTG